MMWKKIKVILVITFVSLEIFSLSFSSFAAQNSQSLDNVNADIPDNRTGLDANGATIRNDNTVSYFLCLLILILTGTIARVILSLAIFVIGILFFLGNRPFFSVPEFMLLKQNTQLWFSPCDVYSQINRIP